MASSYLAPGVYTVTIDNSQVVVSTSQTIPGFYGPAHKGPVDSDANGNAGKPTLITSFNQFVSLYGPPTAACPMGYGVYKFFKAATANGFGGFCYVGRCSDGTDTVATTSIPLVTGGSPVSVPTPFTGFDNNHTQVQISFGAVGTDSTGSKSQALTVTATQTFMVTASTSPLLAGTLKVKFAGTQVATDDGNGNLVFISGDTAEFSGTVNYLTGVITITALNVPTATTLAITTSVSVYKTFNWQVYWNLYDATGNLLSRKLVEEFPAQTPASIVASTAGSVYARVTSTPSAFFAPGTYSFTGGLSGITSLEPANFIGNTVGTPSGIQIFANQNSLKLNCFFVHGQYLPVVRDAIIALLEARKDSVAGIDPNPADDLSTVGDYMNAQGIYASYQVPDSSFAELLYPWWKMVDPLTGAVVTVPPSVALVEALTNSNFWEAPAGFVRGLVTDFAGVTYDMNDGDRAFAALNRISPIASLAGKGYAILDQRTTQVAFSKLAQLGSRTVLNYIEPAIAGLAYDYLFDPITPVTEQDFQSAAQKFLTNMVNAEQISYAQFLCGDAQQDPQDEANQILNAVCNLGLLDFAGRIVITFNILSTGSYTVQYQVLSNTGS